MKHLIFTGPPDAGKTTLTSRTCQYFIDYGFTPIDFNRIYPNKEFDKTYRLPSNSEDFYIILKKGGKIILFYSWGDFKSFIDFLYSLLKDLEKIGMTPDLIVMTSRDASDWLFDYTKDLLKLKDEDIIEIPLGRMVRGQRRKKAVDWYLSSIMNLIKRNVLPGLMHEL